MTSPSAIDGGLRQRIASIMSSLGLAQDGGDVRPERLDGGASNENFLVDGPSGRAVLRIAAPPSLGDRFGLDRWRGFVAHRAAQAVGVAPALLGIGLPSGHSLVEYIDGAVLERHQLADGSNIEDVARALARVHASDVECGRFDAGEEVRRFVRIAREENLSLPADIDDLTDLCEQIADVLAANDIPLVLGHNDMQIANLIRGRDGAMWIIDWEYGGRNNPYFDLAMLVSNAALSPGDTERLAAAYFGVVRTEDLARIQLERFRSSMREALWSVVAEPVLQTGWDFPGWAAEFFETARATRDLIHRDGTLAAADRKGR